MVQTPRARDSEVYDALTVRVNGALDYHAR
jgi:hypothetical protein